MRDKKAVAVFLTLTFALSGICYFARIAGGDAAARITPILMWCPGIAAFIIQRLFYVQEEILGFHKSSLSLLLWAFFIPVLYLGVSYGFYWMVFKGTFSVQTGYTLPALFILPASAFANAVGEEIGWRGFLFPKMSEIWNVKTAIAISGFIWAVWHFPLIIAGVYQPDTPLWYALPVFTIETVAMAAVLSFLRLKSNSVWPAAILHASHNYFDQVIFSPLTNGSNRSYYVGETGFITAVSVIVIAAISWTGDSRGGK